MPKHESVLKEAHKIVNSVRAGEYGDPVRNAVREAIIMTVTTGRTVTPIDVCSMKLSMKLVRSRRSYRRDTNVDIAGYAEIQERVQQGMRDGTIKDMIHQMLGDLL